MLSRQVLKNYSKVINLHQIQIRLLTQNTKCKGPNCPSSQDIINKKSIESRYEECEELLRIKKIQKALQTITKTIKMDNEGIPINDIKIFMNASYVKSLESWNKFISSKELKTAKNCAICSYILSYKGLQMTRQKLPELIQAIITSNSYKMLKEEGSKLAEQSINYMKTVLNNRSIKK